MTTTAFIGARKGSKRLPGKNKKLFHGKPLVQWSIDQAKESEVFDRIVVSSDDDDILAIADKTGVVPVQRHPDLAKDTTDINDVIYDFFVREENHCDYCRLSSFNNFISIFGKCYIKRNVCLYRYFFGGFFYRIYGKREMLVIRRCIGWPKSYYWCVNY